MNLLNSGLKEDVKWGAVLHVFDCTYSKSAFVMYFMSVPAIYCNCMYFYLAKSSTAYANTDLAQPLESLAEVEG